MSGEESLQDLRAWRRAHVDWLVGADEATQRLHDAFALLLAEYGIRAQTEESLRAALGRELEDAQRPTFTASSAAARL
jgi:hypothetical protein